MEFEIVMMKQKKNFFLMILEMILQIKHNNIELESDQTLSVNCFGNTKNP